MPETDAQAPDAVIEHLREVVAGLTVQRDEAEDRFVRAREEASELEQEVADKMREIAGYKRLLEQAREERDDWIVRCVVVSALGAIVLGEFICTLF